MDRTNVVTIAPRAARPSSDTSPPIPAKRPARAAAPARVQLRVPLDAVADIERSVALLAGAADRALSFIKSNRRGDPDATAAGVRRILECANHQLNAYVHGR